MVEARVVKAFWDDQLASLPICQVLLSNFGEIKREITAFINDRSVLVEYPKYLVDGGYQLYDNHWTAYPMSVFRGEHVEINGTDESKAMIDQMTVNARTRMPLISSIIAPYEEQGMLANSFISRLLPGSIIRPHTGWATDWMRLHLGIICDPGCNITVGDRTRTWEEGKLLAFSDAGPLPHSVLHQGTQERVIFSVDLDISWLIAQGAVDPYLLGLDRYLK
jgi:hypothetical protein